MRLFRHFIYSALALLAMGLLIPACKDFDDEQANLVKNHDHKVVSDWNGLFLDVERHSDGYRPGPAPRALAYLSLSSYEAAVSGMPEFNSVAQLYSGLNIPEPDGSSYYWPEVVNASWGYMMPLFFVSASDVYKQKMTTLENQYYDQAVAEVGQEIADRSRDYGKAVAKAVWEWSKTDAIGHDHYLDPFGTYDWQAHYDGIGDWVATTPGPGKGMFPDWGQVRTFALPETAKLSRPPLPFSQDPNSKLYAQALEVYAQNTPSLSYEDEWVAEFWSDDLVDLTFSPPARWIAVANQVYALENTDLETALYANVKVSMAINDAGVGCWNSKYHYNVERPQTYINRLIDQDWKPSLFNPLTGEEGITPSFPAYPSGHATFASAGAEALASVFGYDYSLTDRCHENRSEFEGTPRTFGSFLEMAQENAWSRVPLGVHFRMDAEEGVRYGTEIGRYVNALPWKK